MTFILAFLILGCVAFVFAICAVVLGGRFE